MIYDVRHRTVFGYEHSVSISQHVLHVQPRNSESQNRIEYRLDVMPEPSTHASAQDYFGNSIEFLAIHEPHTNLVVDARSVVDVRPAPAPRAESSAPWEGIAERLATGKPETLDELQYCFASPYIGSFAEVREFARSSFRPGRPIIEAVLELTHRIYDDFEYQGGVSDISTPVSQVLAMRKGVCQDFAHLQIACVRSFGLAARYVSGYLLTHPPAGEEKLIGSDASHAWVSVWCADAGWVDFDPTNRLIPNSEHITVAWGRDYGDVSPVKGFIVGGGNHTVSVGVDVAPRD
ncbi:MAG TPA: transglutaminase family protein [Gammaproteobacteria bacterium]|nr:transglutaminase family protein [Gammaproteobacteria bacterium]